MPTKEAQREYQRLWMRQRRTEWLEANGPCVQCGSWDRLEVDHKDRSQKITHAVWSWSKVRREAELVKCQVLCYKCHKAKTSNELRVAMIGKPNLRCRVLTVVDVRKMRTLTATGMTNRAVAKKLGVSSTLVSMVRTGYRYSDVI